MPSSPGCDNGMPLLFSTSPESPKTSTQSSLLDNDINFDTASVSSSSSSTIVAMSPTTAHDPMVIDTDESASDTSSEDQDLIFHFFKKLPVLVRHKIWAMNLPDARLVEVIFKEGDKEEGWFTNAPIIANLSVCRESRLEALKTYPLSFACFASKAMIPFNFATDTLLIGRKMMNTHAYFKKHQVGKDLAKVQFLMVDAQLDWGKRSRDDRGLGNLGGMSHLVFEGVQEHTVLYTGATDPLPDWAERNWFPYILSRRWQNSNPALKAARLKELWPQAPGRYELDPAHVDAFRYGGIRPWEKYDPVIQLWTVPKVFSIGVTKDVIRGFGHTNQCTWGELLMDRVIEDIFT